MGGRRYRVRGGLYAVKKLLSAYVRSLYRYNQLVRGRGYYLKPIHTVTRRLPDGTRIVYQYIGRYWWKISYCGKKGRTSRVCWKYVGREKPKELSDLPDPPPNPLVGLRYRVEGDDVILDEDDYERFKWVFAGYEVTVVDEEPSPQRERVSR